MIMDNIVVSVIIPIYNTELYLCECIDSILNQSFCTFELILVDDGSTDNSFYICDDYALKDKRIKVIHKDNEGPGIARNVGLDIANGKYIMFCDSDDLLDTNALEVAIRYITESNSDFVKFLITKDGNEKSVIEDGKIESYIFNNDQDRLNFLLNNNLSISSCASIYSSDFLKKNNIRFPDMRYVFYEDKLFSYLALLMASKITKVNVSFYYYRDREGSTTNKTKGLVAFNEINEYSKFFKDLLKNNTYYSKHFFLIHWALIEDALWNLHNPTSYKRIVNVIKAVKCVDDKTYFYNENKKYSLNISHHNYSSKYIRALNICLYSFLSNGKSVLFFIKALAINLLFKIAHYFYR